MAHIEGYDVWLIHFYNCGSLDSAWSILITIIHEQINSFLEDF